MGEAEERYGKSNGYEKTCHVHCHSGTVPVSSHSVTCDAKTETWSPHAPKGCIDPDGNMKQCRVPFEDPHGVWTCTGSHYGHTHMDANAPDKLPDRAESEDDADRAEQDTENSENSENSESSERRRREDDSDEAGNKDEGFESLDENEINALGNAGLPGYSSYSGPSKDDSQGEGEKGVHWKPPSNPYGSNDGYGSNAGYSNNHGYDHHHHGYGHKHKKKYKKNKHHHHYGSNGGHGHDHGHKYGHDHGHDHKYGADHHHHGHEHGHKYGDDHHHHGHDHHHHGHGHDHTYGHDHGHKYGDHHHHVYGHDHGPEDHVVNDYWIRDFTATAANSGLGCALQCKTMQKNAVTPQHGTIFCYNADELGWSPRNPEWDTRMEVRCGAGYWKDGTYKKKNYSDTRWFYCHKGKWYGSHYNGNEIEKLENGFDIEHSVCYDHASGDDFKGSCDIEHHNWGPHTRYDCVYHSYPYGHKHYQEAVHGYYPHHSKKPKKDKYHKHT